MILLEKQFSCLKNHYFAWDIIILQQKLVFLEHKPRTKESSLILFWLSNPGRGLKGASGMTSFGSEAKFLSAPCFCAWAYLIFASSHLHLHRYLHLNVITLKFAGQIFVQGDTFIWQHVHEVVLPRFVEQILLQIYVIFKRKVNWGPIYEIKHFQAILHGGGTQWLMMGVEATVAPFWVSGQNFFFNLFKHTTLNFYGTRVRSLLPLSLTDSLTHFVLFSKLDWCDPGVWRCQLKTCRGCYCCWCWC